MVFFLCGGAQSPIELVVAPPGETPRVFEISDRQAAVELHKLAQFMLWRTYSESSK